MAGDAAKFSGNRSNRPQVKSYNMFYTLQHNCDFLIECPQQKNSNLEQFMVKKNWYFIKKQTPNKLIFNEI